MSETVDQGPGGAPKARKRHRPPFVCAFCGGSGPGFRPSKEHVFPEWLSIASGASGFTYTDSAGNRQKSRLMALKTREVCRDHCNGGWMSRLETATKNVALPLLEAAAQSNRTSISPDSQRVLARWIYKTMLTFQLHKVRPGAPRPLTADRYADFYRTQEPPEDMFAFVSAYIGHDNHQVRLHINAWLEGSGHSFAFHFGPMIIWGVFLPENAEVETWLPEEAAWRLSPPSGVHTPWPPPLLLNREATDQLFGGLKSVGRLPTSA